MLTQRDHHIYFYFLRELGDRASSPKERKRRRKGLILNSAINKFSTACYFNKQIFLLLQSEFLLENVYIIKKPCGL